MKNNTAIPTLKMDKKIRWLFVFSLVAFICFMGILNQQKNSQQATRKEVYNTYSIIQKLESVNTLVVETESASRGYLLTNDTDWKNKLALLHIQLIDSIKAIGLLIQNSPEENEHIQALEVLAQKKILYQKELINAPVLTQALLQKVRLDAEPRQITLSIKSRIAEIKQDEETLLIKRVGKNEKDYNTGVLLALFGGIFAFCLVLIVLFQLHRDIFLRKKAEEEVTASEAQYRNLIENAGVVMYTADNTGAITFANNRVSELTGYGVEELKGKHFSVLLDPGWAEKVVNFYVTQFQEKKPTTTLDFLTRTKTGEKKWVEQSAQLLFEDGSVTGFQCMVKDITEQKEIEFELNQSELKRKENEYRLRAILDNTSTLIFIKDLQGRYTMVNKRFKEVFALTDEMVINKTDYDFSPKEIADHYKALDEKIISTLTFIESEELVETSQGKRNLLLVKFPLLDDKQNIFGISGIATDITERVQSRQELEAALIKAEDAKQLQEQFLANMSHEIRTPLNGIQGMTSLLLETKLSDEQHEFTNMIKRSLNNLVVILNDVLDFANIQAGKLTLEKIEFDIIDALEAVQNQFAHQLSSKSLDFRVLIDNDVPPTLIGDQYRLKQILINLIGNAVKFTKTGGIQVHLGLQQKTETTAIILFTVRDTGIGISAEKLQTIFERFAQANMDISRRYGGAGLGLAISKGLVQLQGGGILVESTPGKGSVFSFHIAYSIKKSTEEVPAVDYASRLKDKRFLVVEDNEVNQKLIGFVLQKVGGKVDIASDGKEAIAYFEQNKSYDLIIMDLQMPVMDGYETAVYIRQNLQLKTPIIAMTATALKGDQEKCREVGMNDFMLKPFDFNDLYKRLVSLLFNESLETGSDDAQKKQKPAKMYDLGLLEELDDKESLLDVLSLFLDNTPQEVKELEQLVRQKNWNALFRLSHKIKGAVAILQATQLASLLGKIEENAKEEKDVSILEKQVEEVCTLFTEMEMQLREEQARINKELSEAGGKG